MNPKTLSVKGLLEYTHGLERTLRQGPSDLKIRTQYDACQLEIRYRCGPPQGRIQAPSQMFGTLKSIFCVVAQLRCPHISINLKPYEGGS